MIYYDKPIYLSCIVYLPAFKGYTEEVIKYLQDTFAAKQLSYPMDFIPEVIKEMIEGGYPKFRNLPLTLSGEESLVVLARCLKKFNAASSVRVQPTPARLNRDITKEKDFARVVNDLLLQQDNISTSQIWNTNDLPKIVYTTTETPLNQRLARTVIANMPAVDGNKKKANVDVVLETLQKEIMAAMQSYQEQEARNYNDGKYQF